MAEDTPVSAWLESVSKHMLQYASVFEDAGYESTELLQTLEEDDRDELFESLQAANVKKPHLKLLSKAIDKLLTGGDAGDADTRVAAAAAASAAEPDLTAGPNPPSAAEPLAAPPVPPVAPRATAPPVAALPAAPPGPPLPTMASHAGKPFAAFLSHFKIECGGDARLVHNCLKEELPPAADVFLDSDDLVDLRLLVRIMG